MMKQTTPEISEWTVYCPYCLAVIDKVNGKQFNGMQFGVHTCHKCTKEFKIIEKTKTVWNAHIYDKDGNELDFLESWDNIEELIKCAIDIFELHHVHIIKEGK